MYQDQQAPKAFEITRSRLKSVLIFSSMASFLGILFCLFIVNHLRQHGLSFEFQKPLFQKEEQAKNPMLSPSPLKEGLFLSVFNLPSHFQDMTKENWLTISDIKIKKTPLSNRSKKIQLNFKINNTREKLSGHLFVIMQYANKVSFYPELGLSLSETMTSFDHGEAFTVSEFQEFQAVFSEEPLGDVQAAFKVLIFSKEGNILYNYTIDPLKV